MRKLAAALAGASFVVAAATPALAKPETVTGQLLDLACYILDKGNTGNMHKGRGYTCAQACAREGFQVGLLTPEGKLYVVVGGLAADKNAKLVPHMSHTVTMTGEVGDKDGMMTIAASELKMIQSRAAADTYLPVPHWAELPAGTAWGVMTAVDVDAAGNVYAFQRSEPAAKVMVFDSHGRYSRSWGENTFTYPHGLRVLRDGFIWTTDRQAQQILEFDANGKLLASMGRKGVAGDNSSRDTFNGVSDVVMAANGNLFASDGEGGNTRVVKLGKDGTFITSWGAKGAGPGEFNTPHCIAMDSKGRVWVCDRGNNRLQVFDQDGKYLQQVKDVGTPVSIAFARDDTMFVASGAPEHMVTVIAPDGRVVQKIEGLDTPHGIAVDSTGTTIYVAESMGKAILKYVKR
jgi:peptidylamidoglycolate lyase